MTNGREQAMQYYLSMVGDHKIIGGIVHSHCPCHKDDKPSLHASFGQKKIVKDCKAGCKNRDIDLKLGIEPRKLYYDYWEKKEESKNWRAYVENREKRRIEAVYDYVLFDGAYAFTKVRLEGKRLLYGILKDGRFTYGLPKSRKLYKAVYGSVNDISKAVARGEPIFIPEGEKDCHTLQKQGYTAFTYGGVNDWQSDFAEIVRGAEVYILADNDGPGRKVAGTILNDVKEVAKSVQIIVPTPDIPKGDISDYFETHTAEDFEKLLEQAGAAVTDKQPLLSVSPKSVFSQLAYTTDTKGNQRIIQSVRNFEIVLDSDPRLSGRIKFDEFSRQTYLAGSVPWEKVEQYRAWSSHDDSAAYSLIQSEYGLNGRNDFFDAIKNVSMRSRFHPVRDLVDSLKWDGNEHIRRLLPDYLGAEDNDYTHQIMKLFMLGALSRVYQPGSKFDYSLILQGKQGLGKSTFLRLLALDDAWFNDSLDSLDGDKAAQSLVGSWIIELAELKSLARTAGGVDSVKRFLTAQQDKYRIPYERRSDIFLRQCVFAGTTNKTDFLSDETGNRRFLIVHTGVNEPTKNLFDISAVNDFRSAWAEAAHIFKTEKTRLVLPEPLQEEALRLQDESLTDDGKAGLIEAFLTDKQRTCALEIWQDALGESGRPKKWQSTEINSIIEKMPGWERMKSPYKFPKFGNQRGFQRTNVVSAQEFAQVEQEATPFD